MSKYDKLWKYIKDNDKQEYTFSYDDLSSIGSHDVIVTAVDKSGNISTVSFKVNVQEKQKYVLFIKFIAFFFFVVHCKRKH